MIQQKKEKEKKDRKKIVEVKKKLDKKKPQVRKGEVKSCIGIGDYQ